MQMSKFACKLQIALGRWVTLKKEPQIFSKQVLSNSVAIDTSLKNKLNLQVGQLFSLEQGNT